MQARSSARPQQLRPALTHGPMNLLWSLQASNKVGARRGGGDIRDNWPRLLRSIKGAWSRARIQRRCVEMMIQKKGQRVELGQGTLPDFRKM